MDISNIKAAYEGRFDEISAAVFLAIPPLGNIISVNSESEELTGYEKNELEKMAFPDLFCDDDKKRIESIFRMQLGSAFKKLFEYNVIIQKRSKRKIIVDMGFRRLMISDTPVFIFTLQDITDLKNSEQRVIRANEYINNIINSISEILLVIGAKGLIQTANNAALLLLEYTEKELLNEPISKIFDPSPDNAFNPADLLNPGGLAEVETRFMTKSGKMIPTLLSSSTIRGTDKDKGLTVAIVAMDITARKKAEALIAQQQMMMVHASKMSALGEMAGGIAHEVNNPLSVIKGHCELLFLIFSQEHVDLKDVKKALDQIDLMSTRIEKIVRGLSTFSRDQSHDPFFPTCVSDIIHDTLAFCEKKIRNRGIALTIDKISDDLIIECRPTQISQVLLNLLNNAYDAVITQEKPWIKIDVESTGHCVTIAVSNSGPKIPPEISEKIFQPFFTTKPAGKGTGLGLSVSSAIMGYHGGKLLLDQNSSETRFIVCATMKHV